MKRKYILTIAAVSLVLFSWNPSAGGEQGRLVVTAQSANYQLLKQVISGAAVDAASTNYQLRATLGEIAAGPISSASYRMSQGFWKDLGATFVCGDANGDKSVNIGDAVYVINFIFKGGPPPSPLEAGDANCDHARNVGDAVYVINYIFKGGLAPCCP